MVQLHQKHVPVHTRCQVCAREDETIYHALVGCYFAVQCWKTWYPGIHIYQEIDFSSWLEGILHVKTKKQYAEIVTLCWAIWRARNEVVWNKKATMVNRVVAGAKEYLTQWNEAQVRSFKVPLQPWADGDGAISWVKPQQNSVKITVDAAIFENHGAFGIGLIARNSAGDLLQARTKKFQGQVRAEFAEAMAIKEALSWCICSNWPSVVIESDCLVVQAIRSSTPMLSHFGGVIEECRKFLKDNNNIQLYFVKRSANMAAHDLARASYSYPDRIFDRGSVPVEVENCIVADLMSQ